MINLSNHGTLYKSIGFSRHHPYEKNHGFLPKKQEPARKEPRQWPQRRIPTIRRAVELFLRAADGMPWHLVGWPFQA